MALITPVGTPKSTEKQIASAASSIVTGRSGRITCQAGRS
jgi:hypothetical protein